MAKPPVVTFGSEEELCAAFAEYMRGEGWLVHAETSGFDLLLLCEKPGYFLQCNPGDIVGVQAKLRPSVKVLDQARPNWTDVRGPDFHLVLVPHASVEFKSVAQALGIGVAMFQTRSKYWSRKWDVFLGRRHYYDKKPWCPDFVSELPAGTKSPRQLTKWKIAAVRLCLHAEHKGFLTSLDFALAGVSRTRWVEQGWVTVSTERDETNKQLRKHFLSDARDVPHRRNPEVTSAVRERFGADGGLNGEK